LRRNLSATEMANGFTNRYLWVAARRSKLLPEGGHVDTRALDEVAARIAGALARAKGRGRMYRSQDARALWADIYEELSKERPGMAGALLARAEAHVTRLSLIYAALDGAGMIEPVPLRAAASLWQYCEQTVLHVFGASLGDPVADELLQLLRRTPQGMSRDEIGNHFKRNLRADRIASALGVLHDHGLAYCRKERRNEQTGGRPEERWFATPGGAGVLAGWAGTTLFRFSRLSRRAAGRVA